MNRLRKLTALLLAALLLTIALAGFAQAASSDTVATAKHTAVRKAGVSFTTMKPGRTYTVNRSSKLERAHYALTLSQDSIVTWSISGFKGTAFFYIYQDKALSKQIHNEYASDSFKGSRVFPKGTYYIELLDYFGINGAKVKFTAKKAPKYANYTASRAAKLAAKKPVALQMARSGAHPLWYRITLTAKRKITVYCEPGRYELQLYNSRGQRLSGVKTSYSASVRSLTTSEPLAKGTYYLRVYPDWDALGYICKLRWK